MFRWMKICFLCQWALHLSEPCVRGQGWDNASEFTSPGLWDWENRVQLGGKRPTRRSSCCFQTPNGGLQRRWNQNPLQDVKIKGDNLQEGKFWADIGKEFVITIVTLKQAVKGCCGIPVLEDIQNLTGWGHEQPHLIILVPTLFWAVGWTGDLQAFLPIYETNIFIYEVNW